MEFDKRLDELLKPLNDMAVFCHVHGYKYDGANLKEAIPQLFLDTIEKAKPPKADGLPKTLREAETMTRLHMEPDIHAINAYNAAMDDYEQRLKKKIGK